MMKDGSTYYVITPTSTNDVESVTTLSLPGLNSIVQMRALLQLDAVEARWRRCDCDSPLNLPGMVLAVIGRSPKRGSSPGG